MCFDNSKFKGTNRRWAHKADPEKVSVGWYLSSMQGYFLNPFLSAPSGYLAITVYSYECVLHSRYSQSVYVHSCPQLQINIIIYLLLLKQNIIIHKYSFLCKINIEIQIRWY